MKFKLIQLHSVVILLLLSCTQKNSNYQISNNKAELMFNSKIINLGIVPSDTIVTAEYEFTNIGKDTLQIEYVNPDCSCTSFSISATRISPGESGQIWLKFDTKNREGSQKLYAIVKANTQTRFYRLLMILFIE